MAIRPAMTKITTGMKFESGAGRMGCQPPRNKSVATQQTATMWAYSAIKNDANFMLLYSVWKPATSSFSASGKSKGTRFVSAKAETMNTKKLMICGNGI